MEKNWNKSKAVGNIAENIVEMLINSMPDWRCIKFGVENHIEELKNIVKEDISKTTRKIKSMPDFIAYNTKSGKTFFIEVKYRSFIDKRDEKSEYKLDFLNEYLENWEGTKLIIVSPIFPPYFFVIDLDKVKREMLNKTPVGLNKWDYRWNFKDIEKGIKDLFPELEENVLEDAIKLIPER